MKRLILTSLLIMVAVLASAALTAIAEDQVTMTSPWGGQCKPRIPLPDVVCVMRRDVASDNNGVEASILYVQEEISRYLRIELRHLQPRADTSLLLRAGNRVLSRFECAHTHCAVLVIVDARLLQQLEKGEELIVESTRNGRVLERIPLDGFEQARKILL